MPADYVRFDSGVEKVPDGEAEAIEELKGLVRATQQHYFEKHRHAWGPTHTRTQGVVKGTMEVAKDLPAHLRQSLWASAATYPIAMRYSSEGSDVGAPDTQPQPRGVGAWASSLAIADCSRA